MHLIRRQILELEFPREQGAAEMARRAGRLFQEKVLPELDKVFNRIAPEGHILRIDRLEIDLRYLPETRFEQEFVEQCVRQIIKQVGEIAFEVRPPNEPGSVQMLGAEENAIQVFLYFLEYGALPWHAKGWTLPELEQTLAQILTTHPGQIHQTVQRLLTKSTQIAQRLIWQFNPDFVEKIIEDAFDLTPGSLTQAIRMRQSQTAQILTATQRANLLQSVIKSPDLTLFRQPLSPGLLSAWMYENEIADLLPAKPLPDLQSPESFPVATPKTVENRPAPQKSGILYTLSAEGIPLTNAGLVLLAPYLPVFFKTLGINIRQEDSSDRSPQFHAIHILHFLAAGYENPEEQLLILPKILCGVLVEEPVPQVLPLSEAEKSECNNLLEAVIRNWPVLKNTSPGGLRSAFLQRQGLISWSEGQQAWQLRIERLGQDLLLDRIPWTYSVVKLEWMEHILLVEW